MGDRINAFVTSLEREEPPPFATPMLCAVWHGLRGDWDAAHELAQAPDDEEGAWQAEDEEEGAGVHAGLHRMEGDRGNAEYWYRRARQPARHDATRDEGL